MIVIRLLRQEKRFKTSTFKAFMEDTLPYQKIKTENFLILYILLRASANFIPLEEKINSEMCQKVVNLNWRTVLLIFYRDRSKVRVCFQRGLAENVNFGDHSIW